MVNILSEITKEEFSYLYDLMDIDIDNMIDIDMNIQSWKFKLFDKISYIAHGKHLNKDDYNIIEDVT